MESCVILIFISHERLIGTAPLLDPLHFLEAMRVHNFVYERKHIFHCHQVHRLEAFPKEKVIVLLQVGSTVIRMVLVYFEHALLVFAQEHLQLIFRQLCSLITARASTISSHLIVD